MSTAANWTGLGVNAALVLFAGLLLRPRGFKDRAVPVSYNLAWFLLCLAALFNVVRFTAEALKFGRWPEVDYATNWVRYTGQGLAIAAYIGSLSALTLGGFEHFVFTVVPTLGYGALLVFTALAFNDNEATIGFFTIAAALLVCTIMAYFWWNASTYRLRWWIPVATFLVEVAFFVFAGLELFKRSILSNGAEDWIFAGFSIVNAIWFTFVYWIATTPNPKTDIGGTTISQMFNGPETYYVTDGYVQEY